MARTYQIAQITQSGGTGVPGLVTLSSSLGDLTENFQGHFYRNSIGGIFPGFTSPAPVGYTLIEATTFTIVNNSSYNGQYTVYSPTSVSDLNTSSAVVSGMTSISVNEIIGPPTTVGDDVGVGEVTNVSTYRILVAGESPIVIPPTVIVTGRPLDLIGRDGSPWGESYSQNFIDLAQNFAGASAPASPYLGQTWYDDSANLLKLNTAGGWVPIASGVPGSNVTYRFTQASASNTWTIVHGLNLPAPFVGLIQVFVNTGSTYKMMIPSDITFQDANTIIVTFTNPQSGVALLRS